MTRFFALVAALLLSNLLNAQTSLPVLPYPQQVTLSTAAETLAYPYQLKIETQNLAPETAAALRKTCETFAYEANANLLPPASITLALLGKDAATDALIKTAAPDYTKIGTEGYVLILTPERRLLAANTETGLFYGLQTLKQLTRAQYNRAITLTDWPDFPLRAIFDDISRGPIPTVAYIKHQIDRMAELKINALSFYIEHIVQPISRPDFAPANGKLTIAQIKELSAYAAERHMQLIGSFQSFGHFDKILSLPQYKSMGETNTLISPLDPEAKKFLADVIGELCDAFNSPYFNVNCDETFDLTKGRSKDYIDKVGAAKFYADHLQFLYDICKKHGKRMMMWGDVAIQHEEIMDLLPKDVIYLPWEYGQLDNFDHWIKPFSTRGLEYMVCPGILNSYRMFPDLAMAKANITTFATQAHREGATGVITTIWDDGGTYLFNADWYGVHVAAEKSWNVTNTTTATPTFDQRYTLTTYGTEKTDYTTALYKFMELRGISLTFNLNDQLWHQKLLPLRGKQLILNNASIPAVQNVLQQASASLNQATANRNVEDIETLKFSIAQYELIIDTRAALAETAAAYATAAKLASDAPAQSSALLAQQAAVLQNLEKRYQTHCGWFRTAWLAENQLYWLDKVTEPYTQKIADLSELRTQLERLSADVKTTHQLPAAETLRLSIKVSDDFYFKNWMLGGPFPVDSNTAFPSFLYSEKDEYNKPPTPGDFTHYKGKTYRWQKYSSTEGGVIDLDANYNTPANAVAYAYCFIRSGKPTTLDAYLTATGGFEVYCNGKKVTVNATGGILFQEQKMTLPLTEGINDILIKLRKNPTRDWAFAFRLQSGQPATNHKHKYTLGTQTETFDAE